MKAGKLYEQAREISVIEDADVVVIGGGPGGLPAAVAAARQGAKTVLIERYGVLGGLATTGLMGPLYGYAPVGNALYHADRNKLEKNASLLGGIPMELVRRLQKIDGAFQDDKISWESVQFDPELFKFVCDDIVTESGAILFLHAWTVDTIVNNNRIEAVVIESKSGRQAIKGKVFIDGTGDGDVAWYSDCSYKKGRLGDGITLSMGSRFRIGGLRKRTPEELKECEEITREGIRKGELACMNESDFTDNGSSLRDTDSCPDITRSKGDGTSMLDLTRCELDIRKQTLNIVEFMKKNAPGFENSYLIDSPAQVGVRETRQISGEYFLTTEDVTNVRKFPDTTVARGCWFLDMHCCMGYHHPGPFEDAICSINCKVDKPCILHTDKYKHLALKSSYLPEGEYYDIPYGCLVAKDVDNLLISGRCISASHEAMSSIRVIATCFAIGEAAGIAGALSINQKSDLKNLNVKKLHDELRKAGVPL
ncbi:FAD-dependent oxidoreductase [bacterium]|nr:FAD-dependent oxidoreductase [bacterium]